MNCRVSNSQRASPFLTPPWSSLGLGVAGMSRRDGRVAVSVPLLTPLPSYGTVCKAIGLPNLAHLDMGPKVAACKSRLLKGGFDSAWEVSLASKCWVRVIQDEVTQEEGGLSTDRSGNDERQHHNPPLPVVDLSVRTAPVPHNSPTVPVDSESGAGSGQPPPCCSPIEVSSFQPINSKPQRRGGRTTSRRPTKRPKTRADPASESGQSNNLLSDVARGGPSAPVVPTLGPTERTSGRGSRPNESGVGEVPGNLDGQGPWDESGRSANPPAGSPLPGLSPHHVENAASPSQLDLSVEWGVGSVEQPSVPGSHAPCLPQEHSPIGTNIAGPPGCDGGADSHDVPPLELLAAAAEQVDGIERLRPRDTNLSGAPIEEETAAANPGQEKSQRAGTPRPSDIDLGNAWTSELSAFAFPTPLPISNPTTPVPHGIRDAESRQIDELNQESVQPGFAKQQSSCPWKPLHQRNRSVPTGLQLQLTMQCRVPDTAQSITFALKGNIDGLKDLFSRGLASPRDVSESRGFSLMRVGFATTFSLDCALKQR